MASPGRDKEGFTIVGRRRQKKKAEHSPLSFTFLLGGGRIIGELFLASYFKSSYFGELFLCKLDY